MSRRLLSAATILVLMALLVLAAFLGWNALTAPFPGLSTKSASAASKCGAHVAKGGVVHTADVTVSVYNAGTRSGLAGQTQQQLTSRGFIAGDVGNAPGSLANVKFVRVLARKLPDPAATLVALQFGPHTAVQHERTDLGPGVEVVVGDRFVGLKKAPRHVRAQVPTTGC